MFSNYGKICTELYDFTKPVGHSIGGDIEYYQARLKNCKGRVLEAAVGSGRFIIPLLEAGYQVEGLDYSSDMLASCRERCESRGLKTNLYEADLKSFSLPHQYEAIVIPTGSFCLIENRADALSALDRFYEHLLPGGRLIVDLIMPHEWEDGKIQTSTFTLPNGEGITLEDKSMTMDFIQQNTVSYLKYEKWRNGKLVDTELQKFTLKWYGIDEFKEILERIGFFEISISADYQYKTYPTQADQVITFEAIKKQ